MKNKYTKWVVWFLATFLLLLGMMGGFVAWIDPYFHYHKPLSYVKYELNNERYQNNGIVKHFEYDAIITGSSMTECFKPSELNALFGVNAIKVPYSGGSYKEVGDNLKIAMKYNPDVKMVVRCIDANAFFTDKDLVNYSDYPDYLYDDSIWNDASYVFNKEILITALQNLRGYLADKTNYMSFDDYVNWSNYAQYGEASVRAAYNRDEVEAVSEMLPITEEEYEMMEKTIAQNITSIAADNPETEFYYYISPYSIFCFEYWHRSGQLERYLLAEKFYIEKLLEYDNIHVFSFFSDYETITNLDNYKDIAHHRGEVNSQILKWMAEGKYELTKENYEAYCSEVYDFYMNYDYDAMFE